MGGGVARGRFWFFLALEVQAANPAVQLRWLGVFGWFSGGCPCKPEKLF